LALFVAKTIADHEGGWPSLAPGYHDDMRSDGRRGAADLPDDRPGARGVGWLARRIPPPRTFPGRLGLFAWI
jgi:hypothetical protein